MPKQRFVIFDRAYAQLTLNAVKTCCSDIQSPSCIRLAHSFMLMFLVDDHSGLPVQPVLWCRQSDYQLSAAEPAIAAPHMRNRLPSDVISARSLFSFWRLFKHFLFQQPYSDM